MAKTFNSGVLITALQSHVCHKKKSSSPDVQYDYVEQHVRLLLYTKSTHV